MAPLPNGTLPRALEPASCPIRWSNDSCSVGTLENWNLERWNAGTLGRWGAGCVCGPAPSWARTARSRHTRGPGLARSPIDADFTRWAFPAPMFDSEPFSVIATVVGQRLGLGSGLVNSGDSTDWADHGADLMSQ